MRNGAFRNPAPAVNFQIEILPARLFYTTSNFFSAERAHRVSARIFLIEGNQVRESSRRSRKLRRLRRWRAARNVNKMFTRSLVPHGYGPTWKTHAQTHVDVFVGVGAFVQREKLPAIYEGRTRAATCGKIARLRQLANERRLLGIFQFFAIFFVWSGFWVG